ncbi:hypothetical protein PVAND_016285 [Polypedilum vanderplanki]|uniref:Superoxide dismutase [Cu-Zn] n=1 Tax=Polypedilum vanderplanki TaxID=319348 RepID=A0A9J6BFR9_POLVA|nr:hypothetical protein PVAND_016285 [Polypedilum vanderplanki]
MDKLKKALDIEKDHPVTRAVCVMIGEAEGTCYFEQAKGPVHITGEIKGLKPGLHGFHIHEYGDITNGCMSAGQHFNPYNKQHGGTLDDNRHVGDLGNIKAEENGIAKIDITDRMISLHGNSNIIGRTLVVHVNADDLGLGSNEQSKSDGNSGGRISCGVIGICKA